MKSIILKIRPFLLSFFLFGFVGGMQLSQAQITNGNFEAGNLSGWTGSSVATVSAGMTVLGWTVNPAGGYMASIQPTPGLLKATAETNLGLASGALVAFNSGLFNTATNFGTLSQSITLTSDQTFTIYWNYISQDYSPYNDGVIATLTGPSFSVIRLMAVTANAHGNAEAILTGSYGSTGWHSLTFTAGAAGTYTLGFASFNTGDQGVNPILLIDDGPGSTILPGQPVVTTTAVSSIGNATAVSGGNVTSIGTSAVTARGVCWNTATGPTTANSKTVDGAGAGAFVSNLTGLAAGTTYYIRAYATNSSATTYGTELSFTTTTAPTDPTSITATVNPLPYGSSTQLTAVGQVGTVYWYSGSCGGTPVGTGNPITVSPGTTTTYYARNFNSGVFSTGCASIIITVTPVPLTVSADMKSKCFDGGIFTGGYTVTYSGFVNGETPSVLKGALSFNGTAKTATAAGVYTIEPSGLASANYTITYLGNTLTIYPLSVPNLTGPDQACQLGSPGIYRTDPGMTNYQWTASTGGVFVTGNSMSEVKVVWLTPGVHLLSVTYTTPAGCVPPAAGTKSVTVNAQPQPTIDGNNSTCLLGVKHIYTTEAGMSNYVWAVPGSAGTILSGQGTSEVEVMWFLEGDYWISVSYTNPSGCSPVSATMAGILLKPIPGNAGPVTGLTTSCGPVYQVVYRVDRVPGADTYVWSVPEGAVITSGRGSWSIMVDYPTVPVSGSVSVYPMNLCAKGEPSPPLEVRLFAVPETPVISLEGRTLISSSETGNQWYRAEGAISGATGQTYSPVESGEYWVQVSSENCTSQPSNTQHYIGLGINNQALSRFEIYPVPSDGQFTISFATESGQRSRLQIINSMGTTIYEWDGISIKGETTKDVDLRGIAKGLYFVFLSTGEQREVRKIMIL